jgi:hypothetical protein
MGEPVFLGTRVVRFQLIAILVIGSIVNFKGDLHTACDNPSITHKNYQLSDVDPRIM